MHFNESSRLEALSLQEKRIVLSRLIRQKLRKSKSFPLSFVQEQLWILDRFMPGTALCNIPVAFRLTGPLKVSALKRSLNEIIRRHETLRTTFAAVKREPIQTVHSRRTRSLILEDLSQLPATDQDAEVRRLAVEEAQRPFDLAHGPLLRTTLLRLNKNDHAILFTMHRIISDGWSLGVFFGELRILYEAFSKGQPSPLRELSFQYRDFVNWQRHTMQGEVMDAHMSYWKRQLSNAPRLMDLPIDHPYPSEPSFRGSHQPLSLPESLIDDLKELGNQERVTLFMTLLAALNVLLNRLTRQTDIVVGSPASTNRDHKETEGLIGLFGNFLMMRTGLTGNPSFREVLGRVREVTLGAYAHQDMPFMQLLKEAQQLGDILREKPFQVVFALQMSSMPNFSLTGLTVDLLEVESEIAKFDLSLYVWEWGGSLAGTFEYNVDIFDRTTVEHIADAYRAILERCVKHPETKLSTFPIPSELGVKIKKAAEKRKKRGSRNRTQKY